VLIKKFESFLFNFYELDWDILFTDSQGKDIIRGYLAIIVLAIIQVIGIRPIPVTAWMFAGEVKELGLAL
jgi:hypothetical protein